MKFSKDVLALNPQLTTQDRREACGREDVADRLLQELRTHAPDLPVYTPRSVEQQSFMDAA
jgi:hypothetical protein